MRIPDSAFEDYEKKTNEELLPNVPADQIALARKLLAEHPDWDDHDVNTEVWLALGITSDRDKFPNSLRPGVVGLLRG